MQVLGRAMRRTSSVKVTRREKRQLLLSKSSFCYLIDDKQQRVTLRRIHWKPNLIDFFWSISYFQRVTFDPLSDRISGLAIEHSLFNPCAYFTSYLCLNRFCRQTGMHESALRSPEIVRSLAVFPSCLSSHESKLIGELVNPSLSHECLP